MKVTQEVDINDCSEKAELYSGMATAVLDKVSKQVCAAWSGVVVSHVHAA